MKQSSNLDVLRSIAVTTVFLAHLSYCVGWGGGAAFDFMEAVGRFGVIIFFLHTSLVLMFSMERQVTAPAFIPRFYVRRAFRIYPLSILAVIVSVTLHVPPIAWSGAHYDPVGLSRLVSNLLLIQNVTRQAPVLGPMWSLPLEVQMYIVLPFLFLLVRSGNWRMRLLTCLGIAVASAWIVWHLSGKLNIFAFIPCFLAGVMAYKRSGHKRILPAWIWVVAIPVLIVSLAALPFYRRHFLEPVAIGMEWVVVWVLGFAWPLFREISWKPAMHTAAQVAKYSYGIYLAHTYALYLCFVKFNSSPAIGIPLSALLTAVLAVSLYHLVEEPLINMGKWVSAFIGRDADRPRLAET